MGPSPPQQVSALRLTANMFGLPFGLCGLAQCWSAGSTLIGVIYATGETPWVYDFSDFSVC